MAKRFSKKLGRRTHSNPDAGISTLSEEEGIAILKNSVKTPFLLILDQVQDPRNLGACLRSANAAGVSMVFLPSERSAGITEIVRHVAAGAAENTPIVRVRNLARLMGELSEMGISLIGTTDQAVKSIYEIDLSGPIALVLGAEENGIRRLTADSCAELIKIPMLGTVDCLNVSVATGVCLFEAVRQKSLI